MDSGPPGAMPVVVFYGPAFHLSRLFLREIERKIFIMSWSVHWREQVISGVKDLAGRSIRPGRIGS